jgi:hypothetical protein
VRKGDESIWRAWPCREGTSSRRLVNIADDVKLGRDVTIFEFVNLMAAKWG